MIRETTRKFNLKAANHFVDRYNLGVEKIGGQRLFRRPENWDNNIQGAA